MALSAYFRESPLEHIVSITINAQTIRLLYSDQSGMYGSKDGVNWKAAPSSVEAYGMAYGDNVWVAIGQAAEGSTPGWRSEDYGTTWEEVTLPALVSHIAFIKPESDGVERPGVFAVSSPSRGGGTGIVSISTDQGESWRQTLAIADSDLTHGLQAAGNRLYIPTDRQPVEDSNWNFEGCIYSSDDGESWTFTGVFTGATDDSTEGPQYDFHAYGVGYDPLTKTYFCTGLETDYSIGPPAPTTDKIIYATSADGLAFAGKNIIRQETQAPGTGSGTRLFPFESAAGGIGTFAMSAAVSEFGGVGDVSGGIEGIFPDVHQLVLEHGPVAGASWAAQCCFLASPGDDAQGTFAFVAFNSVGHGGVYVSNGGGWSLGKSGAPLTGLGFPRAALATGHLPWLEGPLP